MPHWWTRSSVVAVASIVLGIAEPSLPAHAAPATYHVTVDGHGTITDIDTFSHNDVCPVDIEGPEFGREIVVTADGNDVEYTYYFPTTCDREIYGWVMFRFGAAGDGRIYVYAQSRLYYDRCFITCESVTAVVGDGSYDFPSDGAAHGRTLTFGPNDYAGGDFALSFSSTRG